MYLFAETIDKADDETENETDSNSDDHVQYLFYLSLVS